MVALDSLSLEVGSASAVLLRQYWNGGNGASGAKISAVQHRRMLKEYEDSQFQLRQRRFGIPVSALHFRRFVA